MGTNDVEREFIEPIWEGRFGDLFKVFHPELSDVRTSLLSHLRVCCFLHIRIAFHQDATLIPR